MLKKRNISFIEATFNAEITSPRQRDWRKKDEIFKQILHPWIILKSH